MKILHIMHNYPIPHFNGLAEVWNAQVKNLIKHGHECKIIAPMPKTPFPIKYFKKTWKNYSNAPKKITRNNIEIYYPKYLLLPNALFFSTSGNRMYKGIEKILDKIYKNFKFDIIHAHMALPDGSAGMLISKKYKKPLIITIQKTDTGITAKKNRACFNAIGKVLTSAQKVLAPTPILANQIKQFYNINTEILGYGIDIKDIFQGQSKIREQYKNKHILLSVSQLIKVKGINFNIEAFSILIKKHPNLYYLIIGDGEERKNLKKMVKVLKLQNNVKFLGNLNHDKVMEYMSICDIFSLPSWHETFGLVFLETMAHGKPIIGCRGQGLDGIIKHGQTGMLSQPKNVNDLVNIIDFLLYNPQKAKNIGEQGKKIVIENFTLDNLTKKLIKIYKKII